MLGEIGKVFIYIGIFFLFLGFIILIASKLGNVFHLGKLPGDILIRKDNFTFYFPLTTSILISIILSLIMFIILNMVRR
jgi:uncharacterized protein HemY